MSPQVEDYFKITCEYIKTYGPKTIVLYLSGEWYEVYAIICNDSSYAVVDTDGTCPSCIQDIHHFKCRYFSTKRRCFRNTYILKVNK